MQIAPSGIWPMLYAFFTRQGRLDRGLMRLQVEACVAGGAAGIAVLGLATEAGKLDAAERRQVVEWAAEDIAGRQPLAVTVSGARVEEQVALISHAAGAGAALAILQPPRVAGLDPAGLAQFFGAVMAKAPMPVGIQNAPEYLGIGLDPAAIAALARAHENFRLLKGEGPAVTIRQVVEETGGCLAVFNGRGGLELTDNFRAGCAGIIPAPDSFDIQARIWAAMGRGDTAEAERGYRDILPGIVFVMQSIDHLICYGKRLTAMRLGAGEVHDRAPALAPTPFGLAALARFAERLGPLPGAQP